MKLSNVGFIMFALTLIGCGPAKVLPLENVGPNETAFVIPLEGNSKEQEKFESIKYLESKKVVAKRIEISVRERDTGRMWWDYEWIPTVRVVKVDRSLVTREWIKNDASPPAKAPAPAAPGAPAAAPGPVEDVRAIEVESKESINFHVGVNMTAFVMEEDAPVYLYYHTTKQLKEVVDQNVRGFIQGELSKAFGVLTLEECKVQKSRVFAEVEKLTKEHFKTYGITVQNVGSAGGLAFDDKIQAAINETANAEMNIEIARKEKVANEQKNEQKIAAARAERMAAEEFAKAKEALIEKNHLDIQRMQAEAMLEAAKKWNGGMPANILPQGSPLMFGLDVKK
jgi:hypothetical protein